jgi:hypothetical protein
MSEQPTFWLRCEKKEFERRAALTPTTAKRLIDAGFKIFVERDEQRIFKDEEYEALVRLALFSPDLYLIFCPLVWAVSLSKTIPGPVRQPMSRSLD